MRAQELSQNLTLHGRVVTAETGDPLPVTLVTVVGTSRRVLADAHGRFVVPDLAPGEYRVRAEQLGFATRDTLVRIGGDSEPLSNRLAREPIELPAVVVRPEARGCVVRNPSRPEGRTAVAVIAEETRKNGLRYQVLVEDFPFEIRYVRIRRYLEDGDVVGARTDTLRQSSATHRWTYAPGTALNVSITPEGDTSHTLPVPSAYVLSHPEFQQAHCFRHAGVERLEAGEHYRIDFDPLPHIRGPEVSGALYLDRSSFVLRQATFRFVNLPEDLHFSDVRVDVEYREIAPGMVIPAVLRTTQRLDRVRFRGRRVDLYTEERELLEYRFVGPAPAADAP